MTIEFISIGLAFIEGFALIISPCILPILPIILSGSIEGGKRRPLGIIAGFIITFSVFTFFSRKLVLITGINLNWVRDFSFIILILFGITMMSDYLTNVFSQFTQQLANVGAKIPTLNQQKNGFISGLLFGSLVGLVWTPCAGPILAAVIVQTVIQKTTFDSFLTLLAFGIGAAIPMLAIALFGKWLTNKFIFFKQRAILLRKLLGAIIIASVIFIIYGDNLTVPNVHTTNVPVTNNMALINGLDNSYPAPEIAGINAWINSKPLQLAQLKGKVVLIDFWAYSCINCVRTLPYLNDWYQKYHNKGLVIIGVHSPEFDFERDFNNLQEAVKKYGIHYPVAQDNNFTTWQNYHNRYWPAHYLIDKNGNVVYQHFGEGEYDITESNIRFLLGVNEPITKTNPELTGSYRQTPETYLGYARADEFSSPEAVTRNQAAHYTYPATLAENAWALQGAWIITPEKIVSAQANAAIKIHFFAGKVYAVMGSNTGIPIKVKLLLNGKSIMMGESKDIVDGKIEVLNHTLYTLLTFNTATEGTLELIATTPGLEIYTFTFGG
ncbi:MAG: cytochrome c biogenesis protein DipZ [Gammaproteobacteria bacterium]